VLFDALQLAGRIDANRFFRLGALEYAESDRSNSPASVSPTSGIASPSRR
jgi:hypothetical protein